MFEGRSKSGFDEVFERGRFRGQEEIREKEIDDDLERERDRNFFLGDLCLIERGPGDILIQFSGKRSFTRPVFKI